MQLSWAEWPEDADPAPVLELPIPEARFQLDIGAPMVFLQRAKLCRAPVRFAPASLRLRQTVSPWYALMTQH